MAETGSVAVISRFDVARFRTVWQLTSTVEARLARGAGLVELLGATFPCGSVTGAPKASAMRLIAAEEGSPRGAYCGAVGAIAPAGEAGLRGHAGLEPRRGALPRDHRPGPLRPAARSKP